MPWKQVRESQSFCLFGVQEPRGSFAWYYIQQERKHNYKIGQKHLVEWSGIFVEMVKELDSEQQGDKRQNGFVEVGIEIGR